MKKELKKIVGIAMSAMIAFSAVGAPASFADKKYYKDDVGENFYFTLLETAKNPRLPYSDDINIEGFEGTVLPAADVEFYNSENAVLKIIYSTDEIPAEIKNAKGFNMRVGFQLFVSDEYYYNCFFSLLDRDVLTVKELRYEAGIPDYEKVTAVRIVDDIDVDSELLEESWEDGTDFFSDFFDALASNHASGVSYAECSEESWVNFDDKKYYVGSDGMLVTKSRKIDGIRYKFSPNGVCAGRYTGWTKSDNGRRYWKNGILVKDRQFTAPNGKKYSANAEGYVSAVF